MNLDFRYTAAGVVARLLRLRVPAWTEEEVEPGLLKFTDNADPDGDDPEYGPRFVLVDGRTRAVDVMPEQFAPKQTGPSLIGTLNGTVTHICYAPVLDNSEIRAGLDALERMGILPEPSHD